MSFPDGRPANRGGSTLVGPHLRVAQQRLETPRERADYARNASRSGAGYLDFLEQPRTEAPLLAFLGVRNHAARVFAGWERPAGLL